MTLTEKTHEIIDRYYPADTPLRDIYLKHCESVSELALEINAGLKDSLDKSTVESAALLHDIGIFLTNAPDIECRGEAPYVMHGVLGADLLRNEGLPEEIARVCERHTGAGITPDELTNQNLPLPSSRSYLPESLLEKIICYADKFYSKSGDMKMKSRDEVIAGLKRFGEESVKRFLSIERDIRLKSV